MLFWVWGGKRNSLKNFRVWVAKVLGVGWQTFFGGGWQTFFG